MALVFCVLSFAVSVIVTFSSIAVGAGGLSATGLAADATVRGIWAQRNLLLLAVAFASLMAFAGARGQQDWMRSHLRLAIYAGILGGVLTTIWICASDAVIARTGRAFPEALAVTLATVLRIVNIVVPAIAMHGTITFLRRQSAAKQRAG